MQHRNHPNFRGDGVYCLIYLAVILWLFPGLARMGDAHAAMGYTLYAIVFCSVSSLLFFYTPRPRIELHSSLRPPSLFLFKAGFFVTVLIFPLLHWQELGGLPLLHAFATTDYIEAALIRQNIFEEANVFWRYGASITVLSALPFLVLLLFIRRSRLFWVAVFFAVLYAASLLQKSYVIVVVLPALLYAFQTRRLISAFSLCFVSFAAIFILVLASNPKLRPQIEFLPSALASELKHEKKVNAGHNWIAYGKPMKDGGDGNFSSNVFRFNGEQSIYHERLGTDWEVNDSDFSLDFWVRPLGQLGAQDVRSLFWSGPRKWDRQGSLYIAYGRGEDRAPYVLFEATDYSRAFAISLRSKAELPLGKWSHIYVGRKGKTFFLGVNGKIVRGSGQAIALRSDPDNQAIVQFGARFGDEVALNSREFFRGDIGHIVLTSGEALYASDYVPLEKAGSLPSVTLADITDFQRPSLKPADPPAWLPAFLPGWMKGIFHRVVFVPGEVVASWFAVIPSELDFAYGCGYRVLAILLECEHQNFPELVYALYNKSLVDEGLMGTMNAASFMEEYANFGFLGLAGSAVFMAVLLYLLGLMFYGKRCVGIALNTGPILYLSSGALLTLMVSGGWLTSLLLFALFYEELQENTEQCRFSHSWEGGKLVSK